MFLADEHATAAYVLRGGRLYRRGRTATPGTSPVMAGGLLFVYEPDGGGIYVYRPSSPRPIAKLPGDPGHWNSPIVVDGHVVEPRATPTPTSSPERSRSSASRPERAPRHVNTPQPLSQDTWRSRPAWHG